MRSHKMRNNSSLAEEKRLHQPKKFVNPLPRNYKQQNNFIESSFSAKDNGYEDLSIKYKTDFKPTRTPGPGYIRVQEENSNDLLKEDMDAQNSEETAISRSKIYPNGEAKLPSKFKNSRKYSQ